MNILTGENTCSCSVFWVDRNLWFNKYALFTMLLYMPMYFWRNLKIFSMTLLQPDAMSVTEYNNINTR